MSYGINISTVETSRGEDRPRGVPVAALHHPAGGAHERALRQQQTVLGSRPASAACHRRVGGRHQHHLPALGVDYDAEADVYYTSDGDQRDADDRLLVPYGDDPVPHYGRGRTYIAPAGEDTDAS